MRRFSGKENLQGLEETDYIVHGQNTEGLLFVLSACDVAYYPFPENFLR
jgi:hypothetical protein